MKHHITKESPYDNEEAIIFLEGGSCPSCGGHEVRHVKTEEDHIIKFYYRCEDCGTQWEGNTYDECTYKPVKPKLHQADGYEYMVRYITFAFYSFSLFFFPIYAFLLSCSWVMIGLFHYKHFKELNVLKLSIPTVVLAVIAIYLKFKPFF